MLPKLWPDMQPGGQTGQGGGGAAGGGGVGGGEDGGRRPGQTAPAPPRFPPYGPSPPGPHLHQGPWPGPRARPRTVRILFGAPLEARRAKNGNPISNPKPRPTCRRATGMPEIRPRLVPPFDPASAPTAHSRGLPASARSCVCVVRGQNRAARWNTVRSDRKRRAGEGLSSGTTKGKHEHVWWQRLRPQRRHSPPSPHLHPSLLRTSSARTARPKASFIPGRVMRRFGRPRQRAPFPPAFVRCLFLFRFSRRPPPYAATPRPTCSILLRCGQRLGVRPGQMCARVCEKKSGNTFFYD